MSRPNYFRRQAETCLRLSRSSAGQFALRLLGMAEDYAAKAAAAEAEQLTSSAPPEIALDAVQVASNESGGRSRPLDAARS
jgi:hypothetical protein